MNTNACWPALMIALGGLCVPGPVQHALAAEEGPYSYGDVGLAFTEDVRVREFPGIPSGGDLELDTGVRLSVGGGYRFSDWLMVGGEAGLIANSVQDADAGLTQMPLLANLELRLPNRSPLVPFIGGGPGVSLSLISLDHESLGGSNELDGSDSDAVFAWQIYGGVRWKLNERMAVGVIYKYFEAGSPSWEVENSSQEIRFGEAHTHSLSATFSIDF